MYNRKPSAIVLIGLISLNCVSHISAFPTVSSLKFFSPYVVKALCKTISHKVLQNQNPAEIKFQELEAPELAERLKKALEKQDIAPENFLLGFSTSGHQVDGVGVRLNGEFVEAGCIPETCAWAKWVMMENQQRKPGNKLTPVGKACDHWNRYEEDFQHIQNFGANAYRYSIEWCKVEPQKTQWNIQALEHYQKMFQALKDRGIKLILTLHHYDPPTWFLYDDEIKGFETTLGVERFVEYCKKVYEYLHEYVDIWITFNSPSGYAFKGYQQGMMPPGIKDDLQKTGIVLGNLLEAHVNTYFALKEMARDKKWEEPQIGILKNMTSLNPANPGAVGDQVKANIGNGMQNDTIFNFFTTGKYLFYIPTKAYVEKTIPTAPYSLDLIGLNYYSRGYYGKGGLQKFEETASDKNRIDPTGLILAFKEINERMVQPIQQKFKVNFKINKKIPIYLTENGIAPIGDDDETRKKFDRLYFNALVQAIEQGIHIGGMTRWALMDNYEWGSAYGDKRYGYYRVDFDNPALPRTLKPGADYYKTFVHSFFNQQSTSNQ